jgi:hypothetical protein
VTLFPNHERGTIILAELPNSPAIAVISDTWRVDRLFNFGFLTLFIIHLYNNTSYILSGSLYQSKALDNDRRCSYFLDCESHMILGHTDNFKIVDSWAVG